MLRGAKKKKKNEESEPEAETPKKGEFSGEEKKTLKGKNKKDKTDDSPTERRAKVTRNNPEGVQLAVNENKKKNRGRPKRLEFDSEAMDTEFEEDGVQIEIQEGEGFSSDDDDVVKENNSNVNASP